MRLPVAAVVSCSIVHLHLVYATLSRVLEKRLARGPRLALQRGACAEAECDRAALFTGADLVTCISILGDLQLSGRRGRDTGS